MSKVINFTAAVFMAGTLAGCSSDDAASTSTVGAPAAILGCSITETVTSAQVTGSVTAASTISYSFVDSNTILGAGAVTLPTSSWSYSLSGNIATVNLNYGAIGSENIILTFSSAAGGTFTQFSDLTGIGTANLGGTFVVSGSCTVGGGQTVAPAGSGDSDGNGTTATAEAAPAAAYIVDGTVNDTTDVSDFSSFTGTGANFTATLSGYGSNDLDLYLRNSSGSVVGSSESGSNPTETIAPGALSNGATYYMEVRAFSTNGGTSSYHLEVVQ